MLAVSPPVDVRETPRRYRGRRRPARRLAGGEFLDDAGRPASSSMRWPSAGQTCRRGAGARRGWRVSAWNRDAEMFRDQLRAGEHESPRGHVLVVGPRRGGTVRVVAGTRERPSTTHVSRGRDERRRSCTSPASFSAAAGAVGQQAASSGAARRCAPRCMQSVIVSRRRPENLAPGVRTRTESRRTAACFMPDRVATAAAMRAMSAFRTPLRVAGAAALPS